jgi:hypothetical protein
MKEAWIQMSDLSFRNRSPGVVWTSWTHPTGTGQSSVFTWLQKTLDEGSCTSGPSGCKKPDATALQRRATRNARTHARHCGCCGKLGPVTSDGKTQGKTGHPTHTGSSLRTRQGKGGAVHKFLFFVSRSYPLGRQSKEQNAAGGRPVAGGECWPGGVNDPHQC